MHKPIPYFCSTFVKNKKQGGSQHQGELQDAAVASSGDQVVTAESGWASKELMDLIEAVPYYDQFIRSFEEMK